MITEAIILAGGLGTRLKSVVGNLPKSLAPVAGRPFLSYLMDYCRKQGIERFVFALGYQTEQIESYVTDNLTAGTFSFSVEDQPLGTGGAIYKASKQIRGKDAIILNADTFFGVSFSELSALHAKLAADCTLSLKPMKDFDRYGVVHITDRLAVNGFQEKKHHANGLINGGVYALQIESFLKLRFPEVFSFEKEYLETRYTDQKMIGLVSEAYFIDIGIPLDYTRAQTELPAEFKKDNLFSN
jgi:D-glycero-alpha-D-manno-heptose 1-phosphate guanylyltransferase